MPTNGTRSNLTRGHRSSEGRGDALGRGGMAVDGGEGPCVLGDGVVGSSPYEWDEEVRGRRD